jgi:streptogramin lyase
VIHATSSADWVLVAAGRAWVSGIGRGIGIYDATSGTLEGSVAVPQIPCASMDEGFGAVWTATCMKRGIARIDPGTGEVTAWTAVDVPEDGESSIGAGEGGVWAISDGEGCSRCLLVRVDPKRMQVADAFDVPEGGTAVRAGLGGVWITYADTDQVVHVDPDTGEVVATIDVGLGPRFFDVGSGGVWVMNQLEGSVSHVDPRSDTVVATIPVDELGIQGGDLTVGEGSVWLRASEELVAQIDPDSDRVVARIGAPQGSGSASAGDDEVWISAHDVARIYRIPL